MYRIMNIGMCTAMCRHGPRPVHAHVYGHMYRHVHGLVDHPQAPASAGGTDMCTNMLEHVYTDMGIVIYIQASA